MRKILAAALIAAILPLLVSCGTSASQISGIEIASEMRSDDPLVIHFQDPITGISHANVAAAAQKAVSFSPKIAFDAEMTDANTLCIYPKEKLPYGKTYKVTVTPAPLNGAEGRYVTEVRTLFPTVLVDFGQIMVSDAEQAGDYNVTVRFSSSETLDAKYLEKGCSVKGGHPTLQWSHSESGQEHELLIDGIVSAAVPSVMEVKISCPKYSLERARGYSIPSTEVFSVVDSDFDDEAYRFDVTFSAALKKSQDFASLISMPGAGKLTFRVNRNILSIFPATRSTEGQMLTVSKAILSANGSKLEKDYDHFFAASSGEPYISFVSGGSVLPSAGIPLSFKAVNYAKVEVRVKRIYENNVLQFLQTNRLDERNCYTDRVARIVVDTVLTLGNADSPQLRKLTTYGLDLRSLVATRKGDIYRIEIRGLDQLTDFLESRWESDYYFGSWEDYDERVRNILVSDLNVICKASGAGPCTVFVTDITSGTAVSGAKVTVYNDVNQPLASGSTDSDGRFSCNLDDEPQAVIVTHGHDKSYLGLNSGYNISLSNFDVSGDAVSGGTKGYVFGERGVWRPGDEVHLTFISMTDKGSLPSNHPVTAVLKNPQGQVMQKLVSTDGHDGMYAFDFKTSPDDPTGNWEAVVTLGAQSWSKAVKIETVKPNNIIINLDLNDDPAVPMASVRGDISAKWLVGNPAKDLETRVEVALSKARTTFKGYDNYTFEDVTRSFYAEERKVYKGTTDASGRIHFTAKLGEAALAPGFLNGTFTTRVFEKTGDFSIDRFTTKVSPFDTYIGLSAPEKENDWGEMYLDQRSAHTFSVVALDSRGKAAAGRIEAEVQVYKLGWSWWWNSSSDDLAYYARDSYKTPFDTFNTTVSGGKGSFKIDFSKEESGMYLIRVSDLEGGHAASKIVMVTSGNSIPAGGSESATRLHMVIDKEQYNVGETARLKVPSTSGARLLVSIEKRDRVMKSFWVNCTGAQTEIPIRLDAEMAPNVYVSVMLVQPYGNTANDAPIRLFGVQRIKVEDPSTHLHPVVTIADEVRPESEVTFTVKEENGRPMSYVVALVDEGLLSLTRFKTPEPWSSFYATEALGVRTWDLFDLVIGAYGARMERLFAIGGDEGLEGLTPASRAERFKPVSLFCGPFTVKARGTGKHTVPLPQYVGNLRVMVIATDGRAMGSTSRNVSVTKPVMALATLPRVIGTQEEITMPVTIFTTKDNVGRINVEYTVEGPLLAAGRQSAVINMDKADEKVVNFFLKATDAEGVAHIKVKAEGAGDVSVSEVEIDVRNPNPDLTYSKSVLVEGGKKSSVDFTPAGVPGSTTVRVEASSIPPVDLERRLSYLMQYPHGCIEQTVSSVFPQLYLDALMDLGVEDKARTQANVIAAIDKMPSFAISSGGMTYWPGTSSHSGAALWGSIYATHFLLEARAKGYAVPTSIIKSNLKYIKQVASGHSFASLARAYACYVLALASEAPRSAMNRLREELSGAPAEAYWFLAAAYVLDGKKPVARSIVASVPSGEEKIDTFSYTYDSRERILAIASMTYGALGEKAEAFRCVKSLSELLSDRDHYMSTQTTAWALNAVAQYASANASGKMDLRVKAGGVEFPLRGSSPVAVHEFVPSSAQIGLEFENATEAPVYVVISSRGKPVVGKEEAHSSGLVLKTSYLLSDSTPIDPSKIEQGTDFWVVVSVANTSATRDYTNLACTLPMPSGWEFDRTMRDDELYQDFRDDCVHTYFNLAHGQEGAFLVKATATYAGRFYLPACTCEAMYDQSVSANTEGCWVKVE